jgi:hypothetical protein
MVWSELPERNRFKLRKVLAIECLPKDDRLILEALQMVVEDELHQRRVSA